MNHVLKVIIGFTFMIALGIGTLYVFDQRANADKNSSIKPVKAGAGCASNGTC